MNLTLRQLRAFAAVADAGSFTAAARQLHLTQSALSVLVRELERELGVQLLDRHTRRVLVSEPGRDLLPAVRRMLGDLSAAVASVTQLRDKKKGVVRVAAPQLMACTLMPRVIAAYRLRFPDVEVRLTDTLTEHLVDAVLGGTVELAVGPEVASGAELDRLPLFRDCHWLICPPDHPLARRRKALRWADLAPWPFILPTRDFAQRVRAELGAEAGEAMQRPAMGVAYMTTALGMVAAGMGLTACPTYSAPLVEGYGLRMRPLAPEFLREVCVYSLPRRSLSPAAASFVEFLQAQTYNRTSAARPAASTSHSS